MIIKKILSNIIHKYKIQNNDKNIDIKYILKEETFIAFFKLNEIIIEIFNNIDDFNKAFYGDEEIDRNQNSVLKIKIAGQSASSEIHPEGNLKGKFNYYSCLFTDNKIVNIPVYERIRYKNILKNIDLIFSSDSTNIQSDFIINDNPNRNELAMVFDRATNIVMYNDFFGVYTNDDVIQYKKPNFFQEIEGMKIFLKSEAVILDNRIVFKFNHYDRDNMLIV